MRKEILRLLEKGKELHEKLLSRYNETLPTTIIERGNRIVESELPDKINAILVILNADAQSKKFMPVNTLQQAIDLFKNKELQNSIDSAIANKGLVGLSNYDDCLITVQDLFNNTKIEIEFLVNALSPHKSKSKAFQLQQPMINFHTFLK